MGSSQSSSMSLLPPISSTADISSAETMIESSAIYDDSMTTTSYENDTLSHCDYEKVEFDRFMLILIVGTPIAIFGTVSNGILVKLYFKPHHLRTPDLYLGVLGLLDTLLCTLYFLLMTVDAVSVYYRITWLYSIYMKYTIPLFASGRIIQLFSIYMVVAATVERFFMVRNWSDASNRGALRPLTRVIVVGLIMAMCVCLRSPVFWEYTINEQPCADPFGVYQFEPILISVEEYGAFNFYVMNFVQVFGPFTLLTFLNVGIIRTLRRRLSLAEKFLFPIRYVSEVTFEKGMSKEKLKSATYTLVGIVTGYLISNLLNTTLTVLEYSMQSVLSDENGNSARWYTLATDLCSIFSMLNSCLRFPLYCWCSRVFRQEALSFIRCSQYSSTLGG